MTVREYVGSRYVPLFAGLWDNTQEYEPLTVVTYMGGSYTSKKPVPVGIAISNTEYWESTGNYNAQIESYRQEVFYWRNHIEQNSDDIADLQNITGTLQDDITHLQGDITDLQGDIEQAQTDIKKARNFFSEAVKLPFGSIPNPNYSSIYWLNQGACIFRKGGIDYLFAVVNLRNTETLYFYTVNLDSGTMQRITPPSGAFKHCNDVTYNPNTGYLVIADQSLTASSSQYDFVEYDLDNNVVISRHIMTEDRLFAVSWDESEQCYWSVKDSYPYTEGYIVKIDEDFNVVKRVRFAPDGAITAQACCCDDEFIYAVIWRDNNLSSAYSSGNSIAIFDKEGNYVTQVFEGSCGEPESISIYNGGFVVGYNANGGSHVDANALMFAHLFIDRIPFIETPFNFASNKYSSMWEMGLNIYVNGSYTNFFENGTETKPFKRFQELSIFNFKCMYLNVNVSGVFVQDHMRFAHIDRIYIHGNEGVEPDFQGICTFEDCPNVTLANINIEGYANTQQTSLIYLANSYLQSNGSVTLDAHVMARVFQVLRESTLILNDNFTIAQPGTASAIIAAGSSAIYAPGYTSADVSATYNVVLNNAFIG